MRFDKYCYALFCSLALLFTLQADDERVHDWETIPSDYAEGSQYIELHNYRYIIYQQLKAGKIEEARETFREIENNIDLKTYELFRFRELPAYDMLLGDFALFKGGRDAASLYGKGVAPREDDLFRNYKPFLQQYEDYIFERAESFSEKARHFLRLYYLKELGDSIITLDSLNAVADSFIAAYPKGELTERVQSYYRLVYRRSHYGWGKNFYAGSFHLMGDIQENLRSSMLFGCSIDMYFKRVGLNMHVAGSLPTRTKNSLLVNEYTVPQNHKVEHAMPSINVGVNFIQDDKYLFPYIGWGGYLLSTKDTLYKEAFDKEHYSTFLVGLAVDWKLGIKKYGVEYLEYDSRTFRLDVSLMPIFNRSLHTKLSGAMLMIKAGFGDKLWNKEQDGNTYFDQWKREKAEKRRDRQKERGMKVEK